MAEIVDYEFTDAETSLLMALTQDASDQATAMASELAGVRMRPIRRVQRWILARFKPQTAETTSEPWAWSR